MKKHYMIYVKIVLKLNLNFENLNGIKISRNILLDSQIYNKRWNN